MRVGPVGSMSAVRRPEPRRPSARTGRADRRAGRRSAGCTGSAGRPRRLGSGRSPARLRPDDLAGPVAGDGGERPDRAPSPAPSGRDRPPAPASADRARARAAAAARSRPVSPERLEHPGAVGPSAQHRIAEGQPGRSRVVAEDGEPAAADPVRRPSPVERAASVASGPQQSAASRPPRSTSGSTPMITSLPSHAPHSTIGRGHVGVRRDHRRRLRTAGRPRQLDGVRPPPRRTQSVELRPARQDSPRPAPRCHPVRTARSARRTPSGSTGVVGRRRSSASTPRSMSVATRDDRRRHRQVVDRLAQLGSYAAADRGVGTARGRQDVVQPAVGVDQGRGRLLADAGHAGQPVGGVAAQHREVDVVRAPGCRTSPAPRRRRPARACRPRGRCRAPGPRGRRRRPGTDHDHRSPRRPASTRSRPGCRSRRRPRTRRDRRSPGPGRPARR